MKRFLATLAVLVAALFAVASPASAYLHQANAVNTCASTNLVFADAWFQLNYPTTPVNGHYGYATTDPGIHRTSDTDVRVHVMYWSWRGSPYNGTGGRLDRVCRVVGDDPGVVDLANSTWPYAGPGFIGNIAW